MTMGQIESFDCGCEIIHRTFLEKTMIRCLSHSKIKEDGSFQRIVKLTKQPLEAWHP